MRVLIPLFIIGLIATSCLNDTGNPIEKALASDTINIKQVVDSIDQYEVQIKLTAISRINDSISFKDYEFQVNDNHYFYPASTVKFPGAVLALEKLNADSNYTMDTPFYLEGDSITTTFKKDITDIFAVSSNPTYNRIFDYLGKDHMNKRLRELGLSPARLSHRLSTSDAYNLTTKPLIFHENDSVLKTTTPMINTPITPLTLERIKKGIGYYSNAILVEEPMDFSEKNYLPVSTIHEMMKRVIFPEAFAEHQRFKLSKKQHNYLVTTMAIVPKEAGYDAKEYYDGYGKFFMYGDTTDTIPEHIKIHNKVGYAYGYLTDCAYIVDTKHNIEYILTATIHVNKDGIFNDDVYEYDTIGLPFLAELGREIHQIMIEQN